MKLKRFTIDLAIYPRKILLLVGPHKESHKHLLKFNKFGLYDDCKAQAGRNQVHKDCHYYLWIPNFRCHSSIAHEAVHISWFLQDDLGLNFSSTADEQQTYIVSYIIDKIESFKK